MTTQERLKQVPKSVLYRYETVLNATTIDEARHAVEDLTEATGFSAFHYGAHAPVRNDGKKPRFLFDGIDQPSLHMLTNYPDSWAARYRSEHYLEIDPLVQHCMRSTGPSCGTSANGRTRSKWR